MTEYQAGSQNSQPINPDLQQEVKEDKELLADHATGTAGIRSAGTPIVTKG